MKKIHISNGNSKCGFANFGFPAVKTCPGACAANCDCAKLGFCYAWLNELQYPQVLEAHQENLDLYREDPDGFFDQLDKATRWERVVRPTESGDFPDKEFAKRLYEFAEARQNIEFFTFTKNWVLWDFVEELPFWKLPNFHLRLSEWGPLTVPAEIRKYYKVAKAIPIYDLEATEANGYKHCGGNCENCQMCLSDEYDVYFIIHGSKAQFPIPAEFALSRKVKVTPEILATGEFHKYPTGKTINGIRDRIAKDYGKNRDYEYKTELLRTVYKLLIAGKIVLYKEGFVVSEEVLSELT
jgi:hypothetical protein